MWAINGLLLERNVGSKRSKQGRGLLQEDAMSSETEEPQSTESPESTEDTKERAQSTATPWAASLGGEYYHTCIHLLYSV